MHYPYILSHGPEGHHREALTVSVLCLLVALDSIVDAITEDTHALTLMSFIHVYNFLIYGLVAVSAFRVYKRRKEQYLQGLYNEGYPLK